MRKYLILLGIFTALFWAFCAGSAWIAVKAVNRETVYDMENDCCFIPKEAEPEEHPNQPSDNAWTLDMGTKK